MRRLAGVVLLLATAGAIAFHAQRRPLPGEWRYFGGDRTFTRYSDLDQINRDNVKNLRVAWRKPAVDPELLKTHPDLRVNGQLRTTPLMINNVLYAPNAIGL